MKNEIEYCCEVFKNAAGIDSRNKRGLTIISALGPENYPIFYIKFRSIDESEENLLFLNINNELNNFKKNVDLYTEIERVIKYCPWCGKNLKKFYKKSWRAFEGKPLG